jgi:hypothetical protein
LPKVQSWLTDETGGLVIDLRISIAALQNVSIRFDVRHMWFPFCLCEIRREFYQIPDDFGVSFRNLPSSVRLPFYHGGGGN